MTTTSVFISYSHKDEAWKDRVVTQLRALGQGGKLETWDDRQIAGGDDWGSRIEEAVRTCDVALLLVSAEFLTSDFILKQEVPALLQRRISEGTRVIPVILKPCVWNEVPWLKGIQARPHLGKPLSTMTESEADTHLAKLTQEVLRPAQDRPSKDQPPILPVTIWTAMRLWIAGTLILALTGAVAWAISSSLAPPEVLLMPTPPNSPVVQLPLPLRVPPGPDDTTPAPPGPDPRRTVTIHSIPEGAKIFVDGKDPGKFTPAPLVIAESRRVHLVLFGYEPIDVDLTEADMHAGRRDVRLRVQLATVLLEGDYPFEVLQGDLVVSSSKQQHKLQLALEPTTLRLRNSEYYLDKRVPVTPRPGMETIEAPQLGRMDVFSGVETCKVVIDDDPNEKPVPVRSKPIAVGKHKVVLRCDGRTVDSKAIAIVANGPNQVQFERARE